MADMIQVTIDDRDVRRVFQALLRFTGNTRPVMEEIGQRYEKSILDNFARERDPEGHPWAKLSAGTLMLRLGGRGGFKPGGKNGTGKSAGYLSAKGARYLQAKKILQEKGHLLQAIHYQATSNSVTIGVGGHIPYAAIHQFGGTIKPKHGKALSFGLGPKGAVRIPARPYLAMNEGNGMRLAEKDRRMILEVLHLRLADAVEGRR